MTKAFAYLRVSGLGQVDGDGFPRQRATIDEYAKTKSVEIVDEFRDEGVSGTNEVADRPGLAEMLVRLESNGVRLVLVETASRLARDLMVFEMILRDCRNIGVTVIECAGWNNLTDEANGTSVFIRQVLAASAQYEKTMTVQKLRAARDRKKAATGRCEGQKPFGHYPQEVPVLAEMQKLARRRVTPKLSNSEIAAVLNRAGMRNRAGNEWTGQAVWRVLRSNDKHAKPEKNLDQAEAGD